MRYGLWGVWRVVFKRLTLTKHSQINIDGDDFLAKSGP